MSKDLVILGTGGFAREVHQLVEDLNRDSTRWNFLGFLDGNPERHGAEVHGFPVLGDLDWLGKHQKASLIIAVGNTAVRRKLVHQKACAPSKGAVRKFLCYPDPSFSLDR